MSTGNLMNPLDTFLDFDCVVIGPSQYACNPHDRAYVAQPAGASQSAVYFGA